MRKQREEGAKKGLAALLKHHLASQIWVSD